MVSEEDMRREQGCVIPCVDCTLLRKPLDSCPTCGGTGEHFQAARMCDSSIQHEMGREGRESYEALRAKANEKSSSMKGWEDLAQTIRGCLQSTIIYGAGYSAGFRGVDVPESPDEGEELTNALQKILKMAFKDAQVRAGA